VHVISFGPRSLHGHDLSPLCFLRINGLLPRPGFGRPEPLGSGEHATGHIDGGDLARCVATEVASLAFQAAVGDYVMVLFPAQ
jgi:hypothetical protein